jgi:mono/diheme cytochrome c family protein
MMPKTVGAFLVVGAVALLPAIAGKGRVVEAQVASGAPAAGAPTFSREIAPILYQHCIACHRPGEMAPMSLIGYSDVRPWARAIGSKVADGVMPPWHADAPPGRFENERRLTPAEKDLIARWVASGAPQGDPADLPKVPSFAEGWRIGKPDAIFEMQEDYQVGARGTIEYEYFYVPTNLTESKWIQAVEVRPGNRALVHHVLLYYQAPPEGAAPTPALRLDPEQSRLPRSERTTVPLRPKRRQFPSRLLATYAPGTDPQVFRPGTALRLPPGSVLELQLHYSTNGTPGTDRTKVGFVFAKEPPVREVRVAQFTNGQLAIPAGASDHQVDAQVGFLQDVTLWGLFPHTHVRGKRWNYELVLPDGTTKPLLSVPKYDFNWQTYYMFKEPLQVPKGASIRSSAWYDNSTANRSNPDASTTVKWGDQTWEEMQYTGLLYSVR